MLAEKRNTAYEAYRDIQPRRQTSVQARPKRALSLKERVLTMASIAVCVGTVWFIASRGAAIDSMNYKIDSLQTQIQKTAADNASLSAQVDDLKQPSRILGIALGRLHMQHANPVQIQVAPSVH